MGKQSHPRDRLIVALDAPDTVQARRLVEHLNGCVTFYKIGLELVMNGGLDFTRALISEGCRVFLDMKFLDIENTVERAVANVADSGINFLTIHGVDSKTLKAACKGAAGSDLKILAVTVLTNLTERDLLEQGISNAQTSELVVRRARLAQQAGCHGVVCSGNEAATVRKETGPDFLIVTPGIRLPGGAAGDQARVVTPQTALKNGASHLVVGRPITQAEDIKATAEKFLTLIAQSSPAPSG